tara:strand:- start:1983 stop:2270 length:288 start_codon:yes stop_codon:yes gene_type:complete
MLANVNGKRYAISGPTWIEVPADTVFEDLPKYMVASRWLAPRTESSDTRTWEVKGSKGNTYTVKLSAGQYTCECAGFSFRRRCRHIEGIKNEQTA